MGKKLLPLLGALVLSGCLYSGYKKIDQTVCDMAMHPFDVSPEAVTATTVEPAGPKSSSAVDPAAPEGVGKKTSALLLEGATDMRTVGYLQGIADRKDDKAKAPQIPSSIPGGETPSLKWDKDKESISEWLSRNYPELSVLPEAPKALPGPCGRPYTLDDLQRLAVTNSPTLREAAAAVEIAEGNLYQAGAYPNPNVGIQAQPSNDGSTDGVRGFTTEQLIKTAGKLKLARAAAQKDLDNAKLALKRARSDLSTAVRNAYFALLVAKETVRVNKDLAEFTDKVYRSMADYLLAGQAATYEPAALRGQTYAIRLAYVQAIQNYIYAWEQLRATLAIRELPLTEVAGRIDAFIPYFDYSVVLEHVTHHHTDVQTAYNGIDKALYNLKLAQVTPIPNVDVSLFAGKEMALPPFQWFFTSQLTVPIPIWDQNRGAIRAAQASLISAQEEPHRVESVLTNNLASAYASYKTNLQAMEYYRKYILPDQVRVYRGVLERRRLDTSLSLYDVVGAQQTLTGSITQYLTTLGSLWTSVVSVADLLQTDDLFQLGKPMEMEPIPDVHKLPLPCSHPCAPAVGPVVAVLPDQAHQVPAAMPANPAPKFLPPPAPSGALWPAPADSTVQQASMVAAPPAYTPGPLRAAALWPGPADASVKQVPPGPVLPAFNPEPVAAGTPPAPLEWQLADPPPVARKSSLPDPN